MSLASFKRKSAADGYFLAYQWSGCSGNRFNKVVQASFSLATFSWGKFPEAFPGHIRNIFPPAFSGCALGSPTSWMCPKELRCNMPRRNPYQKTSTGSF